jgi:glutamate--cysteine ligase
MQSFSERLNILNVPAFYTSLKGIKRGIEREGLRVDASGFLSKAPHPEALGSSLTHPFITTDYSEALLELITAPTTDFDAMFEQLEALHQVAYLGLKQESLWTSSMPCCIPTDAEIPIAAYGHSNLGKLRVLYRKGLGYRYGRSMQTIAGVHYNFSFPTGFWELYKTVMQDTKGSLSDFISEQYLGMIRNILRHGWLFPLLFGASPAVCSSFFNQRKQIPKFLEPTTFNKQTLIVPYGTSLRLSRLGYHNKSSMDTEICYNSLPKFLKTMHHAVHTQDPNYTRMGIIENGEYKQLSDCVLQTEDEHYAMVRPKSNVKPDQRQWHGLSNKGIEYLEIRALDINPFVPLGIDKTTARVIDAFLLMCLIEESPSLSSDEMSEILNMHDNVAREGRKSAEYIQKAKEYVLKMQGLALLLDKAYESHEWVMASEEMLKKLDNPETLPSARVVNEMMKNQESHLEYMLKWSHIHQNSMLQTSLSKEQLEAYAQLAKNSHVQQVLLETEDKVSFEQYLHDYLRL